MATTTATPIDIVGAAHAARLAKLVQLKRAADAAEKEFRRAQESLIADGFEKSSLIIDGVEILLTTTSPQREVIDQELLHSLVSPSRWTTLTKRVVDTKKFEAVRRSGRLPANIIERVVRISPSTPFVKITERPLPAETEVKNS